MKQREEFAPGAARGWGVEERAGGSVGQRAHRFGYTGGVSPEVCGAPEGLWFTMPRCGLNILLRG